MTNLEYEDPTYTLLRDRHGLKEHVLKDGRRYVTVVNDGHRVMLLSNGKITYKRATDN